MNKYTNYVKSMIDRNGSRLPDWDFVPKQESADPISFAAITSAELAGGDYKLEYLIEAMFVKGQPGIFAGPKKALKTNILIDLTLSLSDGLRFLNRFKVTRPVRTGMMSGESGAATIQETAQRIAHSKGRPLATNFSNAFWCFKVPELSNAAHIVALRRFIESNELEVLILDPIYLMMLGIADSMSNLFAVGGLLKEIAEVGQDTDCTMLLCHHHKKGVANPSEPPELENIAWAGFQEFSRQWWLLSRRTPYDPNKGGRHHLWFSVGGSAGHSSLWGLNIEEGVRQDPGGRHWDVKTLYPSQAINEDKQEARRKKQDGKAQKSCDQQNEDYLKIKIVLENSPDGETRSQLRSRAGLNLERFNSVFEVMISAGEVAECEIKRANKHKYPAFKLAENDSLSLGHNECPSGQSTHSDKPPLGGVLVSRRES